LGLEYISYPYPVLKIPAQDTVWAGGQFSALGFSAEDPVIGFSPASRREARQWPKEHYMELAGLIERRLKAGVLVFWGPGEKALAEEIVRGAGSPRVKLAPAAPTLQKLAALFRELKLVVANFNGAKHIAQAAGVPTLGICSYDLPGNWTPPDDPDHQAVKLMAENCAGCRRNDCAMDIKCLRELSPETVFAKLVGMPPIVRLAGTRP
jgi:ADP-heptose:LPS heptosyltransferase